MINVESEKLQADLNHPLSKYDFELAAKILQVSEKNIECGGRVFLYPEDMAELGPGMEGRWKNKPTDFSLPGAYTRIDGNDDSIFYNKARLMGHVDENASALIQKHYMQILHPGDKVLDLMSSVQSCHRISDRTSEGCA